MVQTLTFSSHVGRGLASRPSTISGALRDSCAFLMPRHCQSFPFAPLLLDYFDFFIWMVGAFTMLASAGFTFHLIDQR